MTTSKKKSSSQIEHARQILAKLPPKKVHLDGNRAMTMKEVVFALAPAIERTKKRGYSMQEIVERLHEKDIDIKVSMLTKYLSEYRRKQRQKKDTPPATGKRKRPQTESRIPPQKTTYPETVGGFVIPPDTPLGEL